MARYQLESWRAPRDDVALIERDTKHDTGLRVSTWGGWMWTEKGSARKYRTDSVGEGLWMRPEGKADWQQIQGTSQFSLPEDRQAALRKLARLGYEIEPA